MKKSRVSKTSRKSKASAETVTAAFLKRWPLPALKDSGDKENRGRVLVIAGSKGLSGAAILAATASLRAGAGKLQIAVPDCIAESVAAQIPESLVIGLSESKPGVITNGAFKQLAEKFERADSILIGPGMDGSPKGKKMLSSLLTQILKKLKHKIVILDAGALDCLRDQRELTRASECEVVITPHAGEMAGLLGRDKEEIAREPSRIASEVASEYGITVVLKGAETITASPDGTLYRNVNGNAGLGTSGSGDVLAGVIAGLAARGASASKASVWGVYLHAAAGDRLAKEIGPLGYLARELLVCIPKESAKLTR